MPAREMALPCGEWLGIWEQVNSLFNVLTFVIILSFLSSQLAWQAAYMND